MSKKKKQFVVIWWRKGLKEWRILGNNTDSYSINTEKVREFFKTHKILQVTNEYSRFIYQLEER